MKKNPQVFCFIQQPEINETKTSIRGLSSIIYIALVLGENIYVGTHWNHLTETLPMSTTAHAFIEKYKKYHIFFVEKLVFSKTMIQCIVV